VKKRTKSVTKLLGPGWRYIGEHVSKRIDNSAFVDGYTGSSHISMNRFPAVELKYIWKNDDLGLMLVGRYSNRGVLNPNYQEWRYRFRHRRKWLSPTFSDKESIGRILRQVLHETSGHSRHSVSGMRSTG
jgi:hypothetical protein